MSAGEVLGEIESTKSVSDLFAPVTGTVVARNDTVQDTPELVNTDPYGDGWLLEIVVADGDALSDLLDAPTYAAQIAGSLDATPRPPIDPRSEPQLGSLRRRSEGLFPQLR